MALEASSRLSQSLWGNMNAFSDDTGYFDGFRQIGEHYGPFDLTLIETGAYNLAWPNVHMQPEQSLQAHLDLRGRWLLPIHNGTFDLSIHK